VLRRDFCAALICSLGVSAARNGWAVASKAQPFDVTRYGAIGNGQVDCTESIQRAIAAAASQQGTVYLPLGTFLVRGIALARGVRGIYGPGVLRGSSSTAEAVLLAKGSSDRPLEDLHIEVSIDCGPTRRGMFFQHVIDSRIERSRITNLSVDGGDGVRIHFGCKRIEVIGCHIACAKDVPYGTYRQGLHGIRVVGETASPTAGFLEHGEFSSPNVTTRTHHIANNVVLDGTHGIEIFGASDVRVTGNKCIGQSHRNVICSPSAKGVQIEENDLQECGSSGIHCAFGSTDILILRNKIRSSSVLEGNDASAIQMYMGCKRVVAQENDVEGNFTYGIHGSFATTDCRWIGNKVRFHGGLALAGLSIESDWTVLPTAQRRFTRPRRSPALRRAAQPTRAFELADNNVSGPVCGISLAQIYDALLDSIAIHRNTIRLAREKSERILACVEDKSGTLENISFSDNYSDTLEQDDAYLLTRGRSHFATYRPTKAIPQSPR
jgi:hypothetical protein